MTIAHQVAQDRAREQTFQAWQTARFYLQGKSKKGMPTLKDAMNEIGGGKGGRVSPPQSPIAALAALQIIASRHGMRMRRVNVRVRGQ